VVAAYSQAPESPPAMHPAPFMCGRWQIGPGNGPGPPRGAGEKGAGGFQASKPACWVSGSVAVWQCWRFPGLEIIPALDLPAASWPILPFFMPMTILFLTCGIRLYSLHFNDNNTGEDER